MQPAAGVLAVKVSESVETTAMVATGSGVTAAIPPKAANSIQIELAKGQEAEMLAGYRLAALRATEDVENALSALVKREEQAAVLTQGVDSLSRARGACSLVPSRLQPWSAPGRDLRAGSRG